MYLIFAVMYGGSGALLGYLAYLAISLLLVVQPWWLLPALGAGVGILIAWAVVDASR